MLIGAYMHAYTSWCEKVHIDSTMLTCSLALRVHQLSCFRITNVNSFTLYLCFLHTAEGNPSNFEQLKVNRPNTINIGEAICAEGLNTVTFSAKAGAVAGDVTLMSKEFHKQWDHENGNKTVTVPCRPLSAMLKQHNIAHIDFFR
jgi:hypothetical protein